MKAEWRIFGILTAFLFAMAGLYGWWTWADSSPHRVEWIGTVALILSALLCLMCGGYFWFVSRRIDPRPEDRPDAEIVDGAGEVGFFSPSSYWPFGTALSALIAALGTVFWMPWLIAVGIIAVLLTTGGLLLEYYSGSRSVEH